MRVMWLGNIILPAIAEKENSPAVFVGGWMVGLSKHLSSMKHEFFAKARKRICFTANHSFTRI